MRAGRRPRPLLRRQRRRRAGLGRRGHSPGAGRRRRDRRVRSAGGGPEPRLRAGTRHRGRLVLGVQRLGAAGGGRHRARDAPVRLAQPGSAIALAAGYNHACAVATDHALWCWGDNTEGQLGQADLPGAPNALQPVRVGSDSDWLGVAGGQGHTCGVARAGHDVVLGAKHAAGAGGRAQRRTGPHADPGRHVHRLDGGGRRRAGQLVWHSHRRHALVLGGQQVRAARRAARDRRRRGPAPGRQPGRLGRDQRRRVRGLRRPV